MGFSISRGLTRCSTNFRVHSLTLFAIALSYHCTHLACKGDCYFSRGYSRDWLRNIFLYHLQVLNNFPSFFLISL